MVNDLQSTTIRHHPSLSHSPMITARQGEPRTGSLRCHQTWRAGKWSIYIGDFPIKTSLHISSYGIFQPAMFDDTSLGTRSGIGLTCFLLAPVSLISCSSRWDEVNTLQLQGGVRGETYPTHLVVLFGNDRHSYWKWSFIVEFPIEHCDFP